MQNNFREMLGKHIDAQIYHMQCDETYASGWMLGESVLESTTDLEQLYLERMLHLLVVCGEAELEVAGLNEEGEYLYHRVD